MYDLSKLSAGPAKILLGLCLPLATATNVSAQFDLACHTGLPIPGHHDCAPKDRPPVPTYPPGAPRQNGRANGPDSPKVTVTANGEAATADHHVQVVAGEPVTINVACSAPPGDHPPSTNFYNISSAIGGFDPTRTHNDQVLPIDRSKPVFFTKAGRTAVMTDTCVDYTGHLTITEADFDVVGPTDPKVQVTTGSVQLHSLRFGYFGKDGRKGAGIEFDATVTQPVKSAGTLVYAQFIKRDDIFISGGPDVVPPCHAGTGLDGNFPYGPQSAVTKEQPTARSVANDGPDMGIDPEYSKYQREFAAETDLLWQSNTPGSIPVPVGRINWSVSAGIERKDNQYALLPSSHNETGLQQLTELPRWSNVRESGPMTCASR